MSSGSRTGAAAAAGVLLLLGLFLFAVPVIAAGGLAPTDGVCGPGGTAQTVAGAHLDAEQMANAATIVSVTAGRGLPPYAATLALATAYQESTLRNITTAVDHDSLGLFQQRVIYYTAPVAADPVRATSLFLDLLVRQPDWQTRPLTDVAADIQRPNEAYRGRYAQWQPLAAALTAQLWTGLPGPGVSVQPGVPCPGSGADGANPAAPATSTPGPGGLALTGSQAGNAATRFALAQLGKPYLWGGTGPGSWDCSGLTMAAWASVGVPITRVSYSQATQGTPVSVQDARSGDLVLIPGSNGTPERPRHVGMIAGVDAAATVWLIEAPRTGLTVRLTPINGWANQIVSIRRVG